MYEDLDTIGFTQAKVRQVRPDTQVADHDRIVVKKICRHAATHAPGTINICAQATRAHLLSVALSAADGTINVLALDRLPGPAHRILQRIVQGVRRLWCTAHFQVRHQDHAELRSAHREEHAQKEYWTVAHAVTLTVLIVAAESEGVRCKQEQSRTNCQSSLPTLSNIAAFPISRIRKPSVLVPTNG